MFLSHRCFPTVPKTCHVFSNVYKNKKSKPECIRCFFKKQSKKSNEVQKEVDQQPLKGFNDPRFTDIYIKHLFDFEAQKQGYKNFFNEFKLLKNEIVENYKNAYNFRIDPTKNRVDLLFKFKNPEDLEGFSVRTDGTYNMGYSSASFKLTENETAIFSGNICTDIPNTKIGKPGFVNLSFPKQHLSFFRVKPYDLSEYSHLVLKIRGDGRTYLVLLHLPKSYNEVKYNIYNHQLHTRGGPYWQIVKLPFQDFWHSLNGKVFDQQTSHIPLRQIEKLSITTGAYDGPFKLEIDYVGVELQEYQKAITPYEQYRLDQ